MRQIVYLFFLISFNLIYADISWSPIEEIAHSGVLYHNIVTDSKGNSYAVWLREDQNNCILETAVKPFQGKWENPIFLSQRIKEKTDIPAMIVDSLDRAHLFWIENDENGYSLKTSVKSLNEKWSSSETITSGNYKLSDICLAKNSFGYIFAAWNKNNAEKGSIVQVLEKQGTHWIEPINLTVPGYYAYVDIGADDLGNVYVIWSSLKSDLAYVQTCQKLSSGNWSVPSDFDSPGKFWGYYPKFGIMPNISVNASGDAFGVYVCTVDNILHSVYCIQKNDENDWSESKSISGSHYGSKWVPFPKIVVDNLGNAFSTWFKFVPGPFNRGIYSIEVVHYTKDKGWSNPQAFELCSIASPQIAVDHIGNAVLIWESQIESNYSIQASFFSKNQGWSKPMTIFLTDQIIMGSLKIFIDDTKNLHVSWLEGPENQAVIKTATAFEIFEVVF